MGHFERFEIDHLRPVGTAMTWIRALTPHSATRLESAICVYGCIRYQTIIGGCSRVMNDYQISSILLANFMKYLKLPNYS